MKKILLLCLIACFTQQLTLSADKMDWWREARFGMFIHWGVYSAFGNQYDGPDITGTIIHYDRRQSGYPSEWIMYLANIPRSDYRKKAMEFDASNYDPKKWVEMAKHTGMKYIVITAKHHDGFCLFETQYTDWNAIDASAAGRDLLKDLVTEAHTAGLKIGFYYSQNYDWMHEGGMGEIPELNGECYSEEQVENYVNHLVIPHIQELTNNYDIDLFWFDIPGASNTNPPLANCILDALMQSPVGEKVIYNDRLIEGFPGDFTTPETDTPYIPYNGYADDHDWEACASLSSSWGFEYEPDVYHVYNRVWKSPEYILSRIIELSGKGGNFLLNVGPDRHGNIPVFAQNTLDTVGNWMQTYGEAIYGTQKNQLLNPFEFGYVTQKTDNSGFHWYLHIQPHYWNEGELVLNGITELPQSVRLFPDNQQLNFRLQEGENLHISLPEIECPNPYYAVIDVCFAHLPDQIPQSGLKNNTIRLTPYQATTYHVDKKDNPYQLANWYYDYSTAFYDVYLEEGSYHVSAEYGSFHEPGVIYFTVDNDTYLGQYQGAGWQGIDNYYTWYIDDLGGLTFTVSESKIYSLSIQQKITPGITNWLSVRNFVLSHHPTNAIKSPHTEQLLIYPTFMRDGVLTCKADILQTLYIHDASGRLMKQFKTDEQTVDVSHLAPGIYFISGAGFVQKIILL